MIFPDADTRDADWLKTLEPDEAVEWTPERVQQLIDSLGPDAPILEMLLERGYEWNERLHPRDAHGRFSKVGAVAEMLLRSGGGNGDQGGKLYPGEGERWVGNTSVGWEGTRPSEVRSEERWSGTFYGFDSPVIYEDEKPAVWEATAALVGINPGDRVALWKAYYDPETDDFKLWFPNRFGNPHHEDMYEYALDGNPGYDFGDITLSGTGASAEDIDDFQLETYGEIYAQAVTEDEEVARAAGYFDPDEIPDYDELVEEGKADLKRKVEGHLRGLRKEIQFIADVTAPPPVVTGHDWLQGKRDFAWNPALHPRNPKGHKGGGRFRKKLGAALLRAVANTAEQRRERRRRREEDLREDDEGTGLVSGGPPVNHRLHRNIPPLPEGRRVRKGDVFYLRGSREPGDPDGRPKKITVTKIAKGRVWYGMGEDPPYADFFESDADFRTHAIELTAFDPEPPKPPEPKVSPELEAARMRRFKVGDVVIVDPTFWKHKDTAEFFAGEFGVVVGIRDDGTYELEFRNPDKGWGGKHPQTLLAAPEHIKLASEGDFKETVKRLREEMGRPLEDPKEENRHALALKHKETFAEDRRLIHEFLDDLQSLTGAEPEVIDLSAEAYPSRTAPDTIPQDVLERKYGGYPWKFRIAADGSLEKLMHIPIGEKPGTYGGTITEYRDEWHPLPDVSRTEFVRDFREALMLRYGIGRYNIPEPDEAELRERLEKWRLGSNIGIGPGVYAKRVTVMPDGTLVKSKTPGSHRAWRMFRRTPQGAGYEILEDDAVFELAKDTLGLEIKKRELEKRRIKSDPWASPREQAGEFQTITGDPGEPYYRQQEKLLEMGRAIDGEIQRRLAEGTSDQAVRVVGLPERRRVLENQIRDLIVEKREIMWDAFTGVMSEEGYSDEQIDSLRPFLSGMMLYGHPDAMKTDDRTDAIAAAPSWFWADLWHHSPGWLPWSESGGTDEERKFKAEEITARIDLAVAEDDRAWRLIDRELEMQVELRDINKEMRSGRLEQRRRDTVLEVLRELRPMGGVKIKLSEESDMGVAIGDTATSRRDREQEVRALLDYAAEVYPESWLRAEESANRDGVTLQYNETQRGYYNAGGDIIQYGQGGSYIPGAPRNHAIMVHELGHRAEYAKRMIGMAEWTFWHTRKKRSQEKFGANAVQTRLRKFVDIEPYSGYEPWEVTMTDEFKRYYSGKTYSNGAPNPSWEVFTMGMQSLFENWHPEVTWEDPEYRQLMLGILAAF